MFHTRIYAYGTLASGGHVVADMCKCISPVLCRLGTVCKAHHMQHTQCSVYVCASLAGFCSLHIWQRSVKMLFVPTQKGALYAVLYSL